MQYHPLPPHRTGRADFPHPALLKTVTLGTRRNSCLAFRSSLCLEMGPFVGWVSPTKSSVVELAFKRSFLSDSFDTFPVWPLRSTGVTPLPRYYEPLRLPFGAACRVMDSPAALRARPHPVGSPRFLGHSFGMRLPQPPRTLPQVLSLVASLRMSGFTLSGRLTSIALRNEAESGLLSLRLTPLPSGGVSPPSPSSDELEDRPCSPCSVAFAQEAAATC
jgi:hypothetical protein